MADWKTLWTAASKSACGTASPISIALRYMSVCLSGNAAQANSTSAAFDRHRRPGAQFDRNPGALTLPDYRGSNFKP